MPTRQLFEAVLCTPGGLIKRGTISGQRGVVNHRMRSSHLVFCGRQEEAGAADFPGQLG